MQVDVDYLILGGGIAGTTAAETIRKEDPNGTIAILCREPHFLYSRVLLPPYIQGKIRKDQVYLRNVNDYEKHAVKLFLGEEVTEAAFSKHEVRTSGSNAFHYRWLLISTGGEIKPWQTGQEYVGVGRLQTLEDADDFIRRMDTAVSKDAVVVGSGFIGLEFVNCLVHRGFTVSLVTKDGGCWFGRLGKEGADFLERPFESRGVTIYRNSEITELSSLGDKGYSVKIGHGKAPITVGVVAVGVGIERTFEIFRGQGLELGKGIKTNEYLETSLPGVWAAGDIAESFNPILGRHHLGGNWSNAFLQGRTAGLNMAFAARGAKDKNSYEEVSTYSITVLGSHVTFLGDAYLGEGKETIFRQDEYGKYFERFFLKDNVMVGAIMINKFEDKKILESLIKNKVSVESIKDFLGNPSSDLKELQIHAG